MVADRMSRRHANPLTNPLHYASKQLHMGPPVSYATAQRTLVGYDYVIVGAGAAGCVLANKLSEDKDVSVLLLEAGGNNNVFETKVPILFSKLFHSKHDWDYNTVEQKNVANRRLYWPRGRILGGSSSMNAMVYHHCSKSDFDEWVSRYGCKGWGYDDLSPYLRRMENHSTNPSRPSINMEHRGTGGEWQTGYSHLSQMMEKGFIASCEEIGIPANPDLNTPNDPIGVTHFQTFIDSKGQRSSLATAYLSSTDQQRPNLYVACNAHVSRVLYDHVSHGDPRAIGVEFQTVRGGDRYQVHARKEVIISAGTVNTPQLLKLSGIGPRKELEKYNISVVQPNETVGRNLKDHLCCTGILCKAKPGASMDYLTNDVKALPSLLRWLLTGGGPLSSNVAEAAAFIRSSDHKFETTAAENTPTYQGSNGIGPDIEIIAAPMAYIHHGEEKAPDGCNVFSLVPVSLRPQSSGSVTLQSKDPFDHPLIDPQYLSDKEDNDRKVLLTGLRVGMQIVKSEAFKNYLEPIPFNDEPTSYWWPYSSSNIESISDEQLKDFMTELAFTLYHPVGTARMGPDPTMSVVDLDCRVHGVKALRVMDASVFPDQISGHPTAPIAAMAYKLSDAIKAASP